TRLLSELRESLQQQTATADVLKVISRSTFDLQTVLNTLTESAARLCAANNGSIQMRDGDMFRFAARYGFSREAEQYGLEHPLRVDRGSLTGRVALEGRAIHLPDALADPEYQATGFQKTFGYRTIVGVPLMREGTPIGVIMLARGTVRPFTEKQIELVTTFADQAVIAIENARLFDEVQARTRELSESLEQQTATSEVLKVISSSPGELDPVFKEMLEKATQICGASFGTLLLFEGNGFRRVAAHNAPHEYVQAADREPFIRLGRARSLDRLTKTKEPVQIADMAEAEPDSLLTKLGGARTYFAVPMLKENELIGAIGIYRQEVRPFTDKQIELVQNFAAQAVIAIENTRLLSELRESLQQQTATADVLEVISRSAFDLQPVFETVAESAVRLCGSDRAFVFRFDGEMLRCVVAYNAPPELEAFVLQNPIRPGRGTAAARAALERRTVHIRDVTIDPEYTFKSKDIAPLRTILAVPILKGEELLGVILTYRLEVNPFTDKQI